MYAGIAILCIAYILSQFFRSFLAVLSSVLANDIGAQPDDLAYALGLLFFVFAVMQIPVGIESSLQGVVDLVKMKAIIWKNEDLGAEWEEKDIPEDLKEIC